MEIGGNTNFAVKYNELKAEYDKTKNYLTTLKTATGAVATALDALIPGTSAAFNAAMASQVVGDFSQTKNAKIKTIG
jgi:TctA family transporter